MMPATPEQQAFLEGHRLVIVGIGRKAGPPHMSPVYYVMDGADVIISTTASRFKARADSRSLPNGFSITTRRHLPGSSQVRFASPNLRTISAKNCGAVAK